MSMKEKGSSAIEDVIVGGCRRVISSFVTATTEHGSFGTVRVPKSFHSKFGEMLTVRVRLTCKEGIIWLVEYDKVNKKIIGMGDFMKQHMVKPWSLLIFDYYGNSAFNVKIYKSCGLEADFRDVKPNQCRSLLGNEWFKESEYIVGLNKVEREKSLALLHFNGITERSIYYKMSITGYEFFKPRKELQLKHEMVDLYKKWEDGEKINLIFLNLKWEIEVKKNGETCIFGSGWVKFTEEASLELGDLLILHPGNKKNDVHVCIFKEDDTITGVATADSQSWTGSFFQFVNSASIQNGEIVPPFLASKKYSQQLKKLMKVRCGGQLFSLTYFNISKVIAGFREIFDLFNVVKRDTLFVTLTNKGEASMRIFREDGKELDYENKCLHMVNFFDHWYLNEIWNEETIIDVEDMLKVVDSSSDSDVEAKDIRDEEFMFSAVLQKSNVTSTSHGVYIPNELADRMVNWNNETRVVFSRKRKSWDIGINLTNGRKRFCAGWNKFVREKRLKKGDTINFKLQGDGITFYIEIVRKAKKKHA